MVVLTSLAHTYGHKIVTIQIKKTGHCPVFLHHARYSVNFDNCDTTNQFSQALTAGPGGVANGLTVGGGQNPGTVDITECYLPSGIEGTDSTGTWIYDDKCHYSN